MWSPNALTDCTDTTVIQFRKPDLNIILVRNTTIDQPSREIFDQTTVDSILGEWGLHQKGNYTHAPTIDHIPIAVFITISEFGGKIRLCATDSLDFSIELYDRVSRNNALTWSKVLLWSCFASPKSAILMTGSISHWMVDINMFSGFRSRCAMPCSWTYYQMFEKVYTFNEAWTYFHGVTDLMYYKSSSGFSCGGIWLMN